MSISYQVIPSFALKGDSNSPSRFNFQVFWQGGKGALRTHTFTKTGEGNVHVYFYAFNEAGEFITIPLSFQNDVAEDQYYPFDLPRGVFEFQFDSDYNAELRGEQWEFISFN